RRRAMSVPPEQNPWWRRRCGIPAAEAVDPGSWRRRSGAEKNPRIRRAVRIEAPGGASEKLPDVRPAAADVAANVVRIVALEISRRELRGRENPVAEPRGEALDLGQDPLSHVYGRAVGHMAIGPDRVATGGRARRRD